MVISLRIPIVLQGFLASCAALVVLAAAPVQQTGPKFDQIAAIVTDKMREYSVPGVAFGMIKDGQTTMRGFGVSNVDNPQPVTPDTIFALASISKTVTTTAMMRLVEQGKVDLSAPVRKYLPDFKLQDESAARDVAIWHLLTHTPGWEGQLTPADKGVDTLAAFVDTMKDLPQLAPPGAVWSYNNAGFSVAGRVIEVVTGQNIDNALRSLVFQPIGLTRAFTRLEDVASFPFSVAHQQRNGTTIVTRPLMKSSSVTAGGVSMSLHDVLAYGAFHLGDGTGADGKAVLTRASLELMRTPRVHKAGTDDDMGIGWHLRTVGGVLTAAHGGTLGHCLLIELVPARHLAFAILTNHSDGWKLVQDVERATLNIMEGLAVGPTQALAHRGVNETMPDVPLLATQPDPAPYVGTYRRPPSGMNTVSVQNGQVMLDRSPIAFYGADRAVVTSGNAKGNPIEFVRKPDGTIGWVRYVGRIARKD
jgi:CubicO group peptidase (beta-lactamase class C family)